MSMDLINNVLEKLKDKTGREWTLSDLKHLAKKLPDLKSGNIDKVIQEMNKMGLDLPENTKERVKQKLEENPNLSLKDFRDISDIRDVREVKLKSKTKLTKKKPESVARRNDSKASNKKGLYERIQKLQGKKRKKK